MLAIVIPARYQSTRFPGKPLALLAGKPMIQWVYERAMLSQAADAVFVATDDTRIAACVQQFDGQVIMTSTEAVSGTDRILEAIAHPELINAKHIINVQGDEPLIDPNLIDQIFQLLAHSPVPVVTAATAMAESDKDNPNAVKVVPGIWAEQNIPIALYFSRSPIPYIRNQPTTPESIYYQHIGIYGFQRAALEAFAELPQSRLEQIESLEQMRMLENGWRIGLIKTDYRSLGVDTPEDLVLVEKKIYNII